MCSRAGDWWTATKVDGCAYNFFHNEVQRYLTNTLFKNTLKKELRIDYNQPVKNPVTNKYTLYGCADIYMQVVDPTINKTTTYIWEVKPASYLTWERRKLGVAQLKNYVNPQLRTNPSNEYLIGGLDPHVGGGTFITVAPLGALYSRISDHYKELVEIINETYTYIGTYDDDQINTENINNFIFGECGDDVFHGGSGNDLYFFDFYHGNDVIYDTGGIGRAHV